MTEPVDLQRQNASLRERLSRLSQASLLITEDLELETVLQGVADGARSLIGAGGSGITLFDDGGYPTGLITSGLSREERRLFMELPGGPDIFGYLSSLSEPLRVADFSALLAALGLPGIGPPLGPMGSFLCAPIRVRGRKLGILYLSYKEGFGEFTREDEETLVMFASQAAVAIINANRHGEERQARADLETVMNTAPVGVVVFNARAGEPRYFNREALRIVDRLRNPDLAPEDIIESLTVRRGDGREFSLAEFPLARVLSSGETVRAEEIVLQVSDDRRVTTIVNATPIASEDGQVETVVITLQDMTPVEELERQRVEFLAVVSHELRAPLTSIKGSAAALLRPAPVLDAVEIHQFLRIIDGQADHMLNLISNLLDVARIDSGTLSVGPQPVHPALLVDRARNTFLSGRGRRNLSIDLPPDLPQVLADRQRIAQVLGNLLSNAARHSPETSEIRLSVQWHGVHVAFSVSDDGVGVAPERLPYLFRRFSRDEGEEQGSTGSGLGLSICKGIVEAHGGRIWAESDGVAQGARFTFTLPVVEEAAPFHPQVQATTSQRSQQRVRVLAVDDDPQELRYVRHVLSEAGYTVAGTGDPEEALRLMQEERPHLALLDLLLPGSDGIELMQEILRQAKIPVIFLSGYGNEQVVARALEMGADDYIVKPFSPTELAARIQAALRRRLPPQQEEPTEPYVRDQLTIDYSRRLVTVSGNAIQLTPTEYNLLAELSINSGRVVSYEHLLQRVWGQTDASGSRVIRTHLMRLRRKLGETADNPQYIFAEPKVGYRMAEGETAKPD